MTQQRQSATGQIRDPVSRVRMSFERRGENLIVDCWVEPGGGLPPHLHPCQEERWSVVDGAVGFRLGDRERGTATRPCSCRPRRSRNGR